MVAKVRNNGDQYDLAKVGIEGKSITIYQRAN
jgi:hypothetical protein